MSGSGVGSIYSVVDGFSGETMALFFSLGSAKIYAENYGKGSVEIEVYEEGVSSPYMVYMWWKDNGWKKYGMDGD